MTPTNIHEETLQRIRSEFLEMPGLRLTEGQARRLWALEPHACTAALAALIDTGFLFRTRDGSVMRIDRSTPLRASTRRRTSSVA